MSVQFPELDQARVVVDELTRERHLDAVSASLAARGQTAKGHGRVLALALVLVLLVPVVALAAENAVPGDFLYPVKLVVEPIVQVFDKDAPAQRRVREVEVLFERNASDEVIVQHVDVARELVADHLPTLSDRIDRVVHELEIRRVDRLDAEEPSQKPGDSRPPKAEPVVPVDETDSEEGSSVTSTTVAGSSDTTRQGDRRGDG